LLIDPAHSPAYNLVKRVAGRSPRTKKSAGGLPISGRQKISFDFLTARSVFFASLQESGCLLPPGQQLKVREWSFPSSSTKQESALWHL
jgi:hypothetical protein